ncbi:MAG: 1-deoxy-D-xylulose-5-phosphate synthase [Nitrospirota bacterium]|jgi:1-deoxy-D-xylulose-5-phosphate synthase
MHLKDIKGPEDIKGLSASELEELAEEIRHTIITCVSAGGGHLASSLGVVELAIALHCVFDSPRDRIVWDVGHQSYPHKLLTGRYERFHTLRKYGGLGGFPRVSESPHDAFGTGHSSTSISAALGMVEARDLRGEQHKVIAVIGDGAMTAGLAFEGLNHAGQLGKDLVVVLNDNEMSISPNVGALSRYLNRILTGDVYNRMKKDLKALIGGIPRVGAPVARFAERAEESLKGLFLPGMLFEELGFTYVGPIDGHDVDLLIRTLEKVKDTAAPTLVHTITKKGKGYGFSEQDPCSFHGVGPFELETGSPLSSGAASYSDVFGEALTELAEERPAVVAISAAMKEGTGLTAFARRFPERFYDVGIAEPHAATFAAGLARAGARPVVAIYSTFLQRSYDEIVHDVCLQNLPVVFAIDRSGIVGEDGPTHHGAFDISYLRHIPNLTVMSPRDGTELKEMLALALAHPGPTAIRYPRGKAEELPDGTPVVPGESEVLREGAELAILAVGNMVTPAVEAAARLEEEGVHPTVVNVRFLKPLDEGTISRVASVCGRVLTVEENALLGGFGSSVLELLSRSGLTGVSVDMLGIPDEFVEQGTQAELRRRYGLDAEGIYARALAFLRKSAAPVRSRVS